MLLAAGNPLNEKVAIGMLKEAGHQITVARNGREAAEEVAADHFDVVRMDGLIPEMDGFSATTALREREGRQGRRLPIIALTANAMKGDRERCFEVGMDDYASKPILGEQILGPIEKLTRKKTAMPLMDSAALMQQRGNDSRRVFRPRSDKYTWGHRHRRSHRRCTNDGAESPQP